MVRERKFVRSEKLKPNSKISRKFIKSESTAGALSRKLLIRIKIENRFDVAEIPRVCLLNISWCS